VLIAYIETTIPAWFYGTTWRDETRAWRHTRWRAPVEIAVSMTSVDGRNRWRQLAVQLVRHPDCTDRQTHALGIGVSSGWKERNLKLMINSDLFWFKMSIYRFWISSSLTVESYLITHQKYAIFSGMRWDIIRCTQCTQCPPYPCPLTTLINNGGGLVLHLRTPVGYTGLTHISIGIVSYLTAQCCAPSL